MSVSTVHTVAVLLGLALVTSGLWLLVHPGCGLTTLGGLLLAAVVYARTRPIPIQPFQPFNPADHFEMMTAEPPEEQTAEVLGASAIFK